jgi:Ca-activated chloride channel homolog
MKRALVLALFLLALPLPATAAQRGAPVQGGGSFTEAPLLEQGNYSDTIRLTEELFYRAELAGGQSLKVTAQILGQTDARDPWMAGQLQVYSSLRDQWAHTELESFQGESDSRRWSIKTPKVGSKGREYSFDEEFFSQPGTYYYSLKLFRLVGHDRNSPVRRREFKTRYKVEVIGTALEPSPTPTPTPTEEPSPEPTESEDPGGSATGPTDDASSETPYVRVYLMTFLIGLLVGFAVVVARGLAGRSAASRRA